MLLHLLDNGLNSLEVGLEFYDKYLDFNLPTLDLIRYYGNLKFATIGIQNAIELIIKKLLSDIDTFLKLGYYRNVLTHFGREDIFGEHKILIILNRSIEIFHQKLVPLINKEKIIIDENYCNKLKDFISKADLDLNATWSANNQYFIDIVKNCICDVYLNNSLLELKFGKIRKKSLNYENDIIIEFENNTIFTLSFSHIAKLNITVLLHNTKIIGFIDYDSFDNDDKTDLYIPKNIINIFELESIKPGSWKKNKAYHKIKFNPDTIISIYKDKFV